MLHPPPSTRHKKNYRNYQQTKKKWKLNKWSMAFSEFCTSESVELQYNTGGGEKNLPFIWKRIVFCWWWVSERKKRTERKKEREIMCMRRARQVLHIYDALHYYESELEIFWRGLWIGNAFMTNRYICGGIYVECTWFCVSYFL